MPFDAATIGAYRVIEKIGEGGMGSVYMCEHTLLGRRAAIKMLLPSLSANEEIIQRFFNEARAVTRIHDAGIVQVFDFGYHHDGSAFIVMELLEGEALDQRLARLGRLALAEVLRLSRLVCTSLTAAHSSGIVHRDLKPENIFLVGDPAVTGGERPKILDFGVAKLSTVEAGPFKTQTGMLIGTPVFMSPEQCRGVSDIDARSDIYSMGCVMFAMLTGSPPFDADNTGELIAAHLREPPPLASSRVFGIPSQVDNILLRCLAKQPEARFSSMDELAYAIAGIEELVYRTTNQETVAMLAPPEPRWRPNPTTMSRAVGESVATPAPGRGRSLVIGLGAAITTVAVAIAIIVATHDTKLEPVAAPIAAPIAAPVAAPVAAMVSPSALSTPSIDAAAVDTTIVAAPIVDAPIDAAIPADAATPVDAARMKPPFKAPRPPAGGTHATETQAPPTIDRGD